MIIQPLGNNGEVHPRGTIRLRKRRSAEKAFIMKAFMHEGARAFMHDDENRFAPALQALFVRWPS
jgi:uncharacterized protein YaiI (UPF0178 family)